MDATVATISLGTYPAANGIQGVALNDAAASLLAPVWLRATPESVHAHRVMLRQSGAAALKPARHQPWRISL